MLRIALIFVLAASANSRTQANELMALVRADRWAEAEAEAAALPDPVASRLVAYFRLLAPHGGSVGEIAAFIAANPQWPQPALLARRRDEALAAEPDDAAALPYCATAASAAALQRCAQVELRQRHDAEATAAAREAWLALPADQDAEAEFLRSWAPRLAAQDQWRRFDRLAWTDPPAAARQAARLDSADQRRSAARLALRLDTPQAAILLAALTPVERAEPALVLERARWLRRNGHDQQAVALWQAEGGGAERAAGAHRAAFWAERDVLARRRLHDGDAEATYALASGTLQPTPEEAGPEQAAEAAFLAGWVALRRLSDPARAGTRFAVLARVSAAAITVARGRYWQGRAAAAAGDHAAMAQALAAAAAWPNTYYGQLAILAGAGVDAATLNARIMARLDPASSQAQAAAFTGQELVRASANLVAWGEKRRAASFLLQVAAATPEPSGFALAARLANGFGLPDAAVGLARLAGRDGAVLLEAGWPLAAEVPGARFDPALALGIARQESSFDPAAVSPAGARGLMQLMPATAAQQARRMGLATSTTALTTDPASNMLLGVGYLRRLLDRYGGAEPLAIAAYNAGPSRVDEWLRANGDPRTSGAHGPAVDMLDWIELIPFAETRNYVQRVIENVVVYRAKLGERLPHPVLRWLASHA